MREGDLRLAPAARAEMARRHWAESVASTQDWALSGEVPPAGSAVYLAGRQTAGRGRRGRAWQTPPDAALALSVLHAFDRPLASLAPLGLAVALRVAQAVRAAGGPTVGVKWPNDLVVGEAKLGGVLVEVREASPRPVLVLGLGLNRALPDDASIDQRWTDLAREGWAVDAGALVAIVLDALLPALARFDAEGFAPFAADWPEVDVLAGRAVRVQVGEAWRDGQALGLAPDGGLRVRHPEGDAVHHAGEVSVRVAA